jgi:zinc protease
VSRELGIPKLVFDRFRLKNGLDVILMEDHRLPLVSVNIWYHVGPANERPGLTGFAHLFEHMMFEGSKHVHGEGHFRHLEAAGASEINGTTDFDRTNYFETLPSNQLELALWLESDRMGFLLEKLNSANLENQRDVVRNERRQSVEGMPYGLVQEELFHQLFPREHPYHASVIGSHADIEAARLRDVREFFRRYYAPNNASLAVVGDIDPVAARELVERYFGPIPSGPPVPKIEMITLPIRSERRAVVTDQVELPRVYMAWITDPIFQPGDAECDLLARILGGGKSSRLYKSLVYGKRIAQDVSAGQYSLALGSIFTIQATAKPGVSPEHIERAIDEELEHLRQDGPEEIELERARNTIESAVIRALETLGGFGGVADRLNQYNHYLGNPGYLERDLGRYANATIKALHDMARSRLSREQRVVVYGVPGPKIVQDVPKSDANKADEDAPEPTPEIPDQEWRLSPPRAGAASTLNLPLPVTFSLPNGLTIYLVERHDMPIVSANLIALCGSERNPAGCPGLASFAAEILDEGTRRRSAIQIAEDVDQLGASLSTGSSTDMSWIAARSLKRNFEAAFELMVDIVLHPEFPSGEIERVRHDRLTQILQHRDNPGVMASKEFFHAVYGPEHPYGYSEIGTEDSVQAITREDLAGFWKIGYTPQNSALIVAGDITAAALHKTVRDLLGSWSGNGTSITMDGVTRRLGRQVIIVDKPGSPQTALRIGHVGVARSNPDYVALDVMNTALGGLFSSRININLRETHGYTYGASSSFIFRRGPGPFVVGTSVRTDVTAEAIGEIIKELEGMRVCKPSLEELTAAKDSISRSLPGFFETTPQAASTTGQLFVHGLPLDYYRRLPEEVSHVTADEVCRVAAQYLAPADLVIVAVGDRKQIEPQLEKSNFGPIISGSDPSK